MLTPSAKVARQSFARDNKLRETLCRWIGNDTVCLDGNLCNSRRTVTGEKEQTVSEIGGSWLGAATEQDESETRVSSPGPSTKQIHPRSSTHDSWSNSWDRYDYRDKWTDVLEEPSRWQ